MAESEREQIRKRLSAVFSEVLHVEPPSADTDLFEAGIIDSQGFVELIFQLEQNFQTHIDIEDFEIENFRCIEKIATLILHNSNGQRATREATGESMASD